MTSRRRLQIVVAALGLIPIVTGLVGVIYGATYIGVDRTVGGADLDSQMRFFSAIFLGIGLTFYSTIPTIERQGGRFRLAAALTVLGGFGRLVSLSVVGLPAAGYVLGIIMELVVVPLLVLWQTIVARQANPL